MALILNNFDPGKTKIRFGWQICPQLAATLLPFHGLINSETLENTPESIQSERLTGARMRDVDFPGLAPAGGPFVVELDAESILPFIAQSQGGGSVVDTSPVFVHTLSELETDIDFSGRHLTVEIFRDDGMPQRTVDVLVQELNLTVETGGLMLATVTCVAGWADYWDNAILRAPTAGDAPASVIGLDNVAAWKALSGPLTIKATEIIPAAGAVPLKTKVVVKRGPEQVLSGTWTVGAGTNSFAGAGGAALTELASGNYIETEGELLEVDVITDDDTFTTVGNHTAGAAAVLVVETFGPTESTLPRWTHFTKGNVQYGELFDSRSGAHIGDRANGNRVEMYFDASGLTDPPTVTLTGTVTHTIALDTLVGVGTLFLTELAVGQEVLLGDSISHRIATIADDLNATTVRVRVDATSAGAALTVAPHWTVAQTRPDWVTAFTLAPVFNGINVDVDADGSRFDATSVNVVVTLPSLAVNSLGRRRATSVRSRGLRTVAVNFDREVNDSEFLIAAESSEIIALDVDAQGALDIAGSTTEYRMQIRAGNCRVTSPRATITSGTEFVEALTTAAGRNVGGADPADIVFTITNTVSAAGITPP